MNTLGTLFLVLASTLHVVRCQDPCLNHGRVCTIIDTTRDTYAAQLAKCQALGHDGLLTVPDGMDLTTFTDFINDLRIYTKTTSADIGFDFAGIWIGAVLSNPETPVFLDRVWLSNAHCGPNAATASYVAQGSIKRDAGPEICLMSNPVQSKGFKVNERYCSDTYLGICETVTDTAIIEAGKAAKQAKTCPADHFTDLQAMAEPFLSNGCDMTTCHAFASAISVPGDATYSVFGYGDRTKWLDTCASKGMHPVSAMCQEGTDMWQELANTLLGAKPVKPIWVGYQYLLNYGWVNECGRNLSVYWINVISNPAETKEDSSLMYDPVSKTLQVSNDRSEIGMMVCVNLRCGECPACSQNIPNSLEHEAKIDYARSRNLQCHEKYKHIGDANLTCGRRGKVVPPSLTTHCKKKVPPCVDALCTFITAIQILGCIWVILALSFSFVIFLIVRENTTERWIHFFKEVSLIGAHVVMLTLRNKYDDKQTCVMASVLINYFMNAFFSLMLVEAWHNFTVVDGLISRGSWPSLRFQIGIGLLLPAVHAAAMAYLFTDELIGYRTCWINFDSRMIALGMVIPPPLLALVGAIFFEVKAESQMATTKKIKSLVVESNRLYWMPVAILGLLSWMFGSVAVYGFGIVSNVTVFGINVAMGVVTALAHIAGSETAVKLVLKIWTALKKHLPGKENEVFP